MANIKSLTPWKPGEGFSYQEWVRNLSPEDFIKHKAERKGRADIKKAFKLTTEFNRDKIVSQLNSALATHLEQAIAGDTASLNAVSKILGIDTVADMTVALQNLPGEITSSVLKKPE